jgi:hypothetical protein
VSHWHPHFVRAGRADAVRRWADLEGKSATMRDDLHRQRSNQKIPSREWARPAMLLVESLVAALELLWRSRS